MFATRIEKEIFKKLKILSVQTEKAISSLVHEAIMDLLNKYEKKSKENPK